MLGFTAQPTVYVLNPREQYLSHFYGNVARFDSGVL